MNYQTKTVLAASAGVLVLAVALAGTQAAGLAEEPTETPSETATPSETPSATAAPTSTTPPPDPRLVTSVTIAVVENHGRVAVSQKMPKITALGKRYATGSNAYAITHPSKPNYLGIASGSVQGETSNRWAIEKAPALFDRVAAKGWAGGVVRTYAQGMGPDNCRMSDRGAYRWHHNWQVPFTSGSVELASGKVVSKRSLCETHNRDGWDSRGLWAYDARTSRLGVINMVLPDNAHNWHDSPYSDAAAARADNWIAARAQEFIKSPDYRAGGVFIITADEARPSSKANDIPMIVIHKSLDNKHRSVGTYMTLRAVHSFLAEVAHVQPGICRQPSGKYAPCGTRGAFANAFGLRPA